MHSYLHIHVSVCPCAHSHRVNQFVRKSAHIHSHQWRGQRKISDAAEVEVESEEVHVSRG